ncbi:hypothetical protein MOBT1_000762 [Malassezia obtusa]|uniref:Uncharacterized protein n=1 Tax=Malassezia obtusa TaxID=76774 RepID=A0AAF0DZW2_9BASI|nr:hypothetical protein MOBT1_000762 [Malassezia obtusa]
MSKPAPVPAAPAAAAAPAWSSNEEGWVTKKSKGQALQLRTAPSSTPLPPSPEFLRYCREQLRDLQANVDEFLDMLLSFPLNPSPDVEEIIAEAVYANSKMLDGRRFATDFLVRRKKDAFRAVAL